MSKVFPAAQSASGFAHAFPTIDDQSPPGSWVKAIPSLPSQQEPRAVISETDRWWAQRFLEKSTPGEVAAMRELLGAGA